MSETIFTFPGKAGDAIHQWPVAYHWAKQTGQKFICWMDEATTKIVAPLFAAQPCVERVEFKPGVVNWICGGQPFHFNLGTADFIDRTIYHLGYRAFPSRQLTLETLATSGVPLRIVPSELAEGPVFAVDPLLAQGRRLLLHGQSVYAHTRQSPRFWKFLAAVHEQLRERFDEIVWVGSADDREVGRATYPEWGEFDDGGNFLELARLMAGSHAFIGTGSGPAALAMWMGIPALRVHEPIGDPPASRSIWDGLYPCTLNRTEVELRTDWAEWRDQWLSREAVVVEQQHQF